MPMKREILFWGLLVGLLYFSQPARATLKESFLINGDFTGGYYKLKGEDKSLGANLRLNMALPFEIDKRNLLLPFYEVSYEETNRAETIEGIIWTDKLLEQFVSGGYILRFNDKIENKLSLQYFNEQVKGTNDESLTSGLYNYYDWGIKEQIKYKGEISRFPVVLEGGYKFYHRQYPHYEGLYYQAYKKGPRWVEDYKGHKIWTEGNIGSKEKSYSFKYIHLWKQYPDDLVQIEPKGGTEYPFSDEKRKENIDWLEIGFIDNPGNWTSTRLRIELNRRKSNQNYYDTKSLVLYPHFFDYSEYKLSPSFIFQIYKGIHGDVNYTYIYRRYKERPAQDEKGNYLKEKLNNQNHVFTLLTSYPLSKKWDLKAKFCYNISKSNTTYEQTYKYNYHAINFSLGISYEF